jgi:Fungal specific transcription factor domain
MILDSVLIRSTIEATATAHLHNLGVASRDEPIRLQSKALRYLSDALAKANEPDKTTFFQEELASAIMILVYYETTIGLSAPTARWHLSAASSILSTLSQRCHQSKRFDFLIRLFAYFDIFVAFSLRLEPLADPQIYASLADTNLCPAFGYAFALYPVLHSLAYLLAQKYSFKGSDSLLNGQVVRELEQDLLSWQPPNTIPFSESGASLPIPRASHAHERLLHTALAFKSAALLVVSDELLPFSFPTFAPPSPPSLKTHYDELLDHLLRLNTLALISPSQSPPPPHGTPSSNRIFTPPSTSPPPPPPTPHRPNISSAFVALTSTSAPLTTITWPLHTAALYAKTPSDRAVLTSMFERVDQRHRMGVVGAAKRYAEQIWKKGQVEEDAVGGMEGERLESGSGSSTWEEGGGGGRIGKAYGHGNGNGSSVPASLPLLA